MTFIIFVVIFSIFAKFTGTIKEKNWHQYILPIHVSFHWQLSGYVIDSDFFTKFYIWSCTYCANLGIFKPNWFSIRIARMIEHCCLNCQAIFICIGSIDIQNIMDFFMSLLKKGRWRWFQSLNQFRPCLLYAEKILNRIEKYIY